MSWGVSITGVSVKRDQARQSVIEQCDRNIANGYQSESQKIAVLAVIDALPGTHISGSISGHNGDTSTLSASVTGYNSTE